MIFSLVLLYMELEYVRAKLLSLGVLPISHMVPALKLFCDNTEDFVFCTNFFKVT